MLDVLYTLVQLLDAAHYNYWYVALTTGACAPSHEYELKYEMLAAHSRRHQFLDAALERVNYLRLSREDELLLHTHMLTEERDLLVHDVLVFRLELQPRLDAAVKSQPKMTPRAQSLPAAAVAATSAEASPRHRSSLS